MQTILRSMLHLATKSLGIPCPVICGLANKEPVEDPVRSFLLQVSRA